MCHLQSQLTALTLTKSIAPNGHRESVTCPAVWTRMLIQSKCDGAVYSLKLINRRMIEGYRFGFKLMQRLWWAAELNCWSVVMRRSVRHGFNLNDVLPLSLPTCEILQGLCVLFLLSRLKVELDYFKRTCNVMQIQSCWKRGLWVSKHPK